MERYLSNFQIALESVLSNKMRSMLTALGIIFGVSAVIAMLAIGNGAQQEILEQIKLVGVNNIVIEPIIEQKEEQLSEDLGDKGKEKNFSPGLRLLDAKSIAQVIPNVERISPEIIIQTNIVKNGIRRSAKLVGVEPDYFLITDFSLQSGAMFSGHNLEFGDQVCIIGRGIQTKFFSKEEPIGKRIKVGSHWLTIIGVLKERVISESSIANLGIRDYNMDVYAPIQTVLIRYKNRALVTQNSIRKAQNEDDENPAEKIAPNYHQIDRLVVQVADTEILSPTADIVSRMLKRRHFGMVDYEITIPELLLKQQQRTKDIFNIVLGAIAGISLLVGGIGIMNIMLASVMERIKEIGLRLAIGAKKTDIVFQFLMEAVMISLSGGIIGVILGVVMALVIANFADIPTVISPISIVISFGVAATVGLVFGIAPAKRAAEQDPITSLRYE